MKLDTHISNMKKAVKLQKKVASLGVSICFGISKGVESQKISENRIYAIKEGKNGYGLTLDMNKLFKDLITDIKEYIKPTFEKISSWNVIVGHSYYYEKKGTFILAKVVSTNIGDYTIEIDGKYKTIKKKELYDTPDKLYLLKNSYFE